MRRIRSTDWGQRRPMDFHLVCKNQGPSRVQHRSNSLIDQSKRSIAICFSSHSLMPIQHTGQRVYYRVRDSQIILLSNTLPICVLWYIYSINSTFPNNWHINIFFTHFFIVEPSHIISANNMCFVFTSLLKPRGSQLMWNQTTREEQHEGTVLVVFTRGCRCRYSTGEKAIHHGKADCGFR